MSIEEQIEIIKELIDGVEELNGEYQEGWDKDIENGEKLLKYLRKKL